MTKLRSAWVANLRTIDFGELMIALRAAISQLPRRLYHLVQSVRFQPSPKRIQVAESLSLGGKRFVALVRVDNQEFLVGGGSDSLVLLTPAREAQSSFASVLPIGNNSAPREYSIQ